MILSTFYIINDYINISMEKIQVNAYNLLFFLFIYLIIH